MTFTLFTFASSYDKLYEVLKALIL